MNGITKGPWRVGRAGTVVTDAIIEGAFNTGHNEFSEGNRDKKYYGGNLIAESIWRPEDAHAISALHEMYEALISIEIGLSNGKGSIPFMLSMIHGALSKAEGGERTSKRPEYTAKEATHVD